MSLRRNAFRWNQKLFGLQIVINKLLCKYIFCGKLLLTFAAATFRRAIIRMQPSPISGSRIWVRTTDHVDVTAATAAFDHAPILAVVAATLLSRRSNTEVARRGEVQRALCFKISHFGKVAHKKTGKVYSFFLQIRGEGGSARLMTKSYCFFWVLNWLKIT